MSWEIRQGDALDRLREMPDESVQCCVSSPPYWGLRDYGVDGQLGLEEAVKAEVEWLGNQRRTCRTYKQGAEERRAALEAAGYQEAEYAYESAEDRLQAALDASRASGGGGE